MWVLWLLAFVFVFAWLTYRLERHKIIAAIVLVILIVLIYNDLSQNQNPAP